MTADLRPLAPPGLPMRLAPLFETRYQRFSAMEMARRRVAIESAMAQAGVDHLLIYGAQCVGSVIQYLMQWPVTAEAAGVVTKDLRIALFIQFYNHVPLAKTLAEAELEWGGESCLRRAIANLKARGARRDRVGVIGPLGFKAYGELSEEFGRIVDLNPVYTRLRLIKSAEEIDWLRAAAHLSDLAIAAFQHGLGPGLSERELGAIVETAYLPWGGQNQIHYFGVTPMAAPETFVPAQFPSSRRVEAGDIVFAEISCAFWDYAGQVLRSFAVGEEPTPLYRELHAIADRAFDAIAAVLRAGATPAQVIAAAGVIEEAGFTTLRRPAAWLWRRLSATGSGQSLAPGGPAARPRLRRRHDRGDPTQCHRPRRQGWGSDRRTRAGDGDRDRAAPRRAARFPAGLRVRHSAQKRTIATASHSH